MKSLPRWKNVLIWAPLIITQPKVFISQGINADISWQVFVIGISQTMPPYAYMYPLHTAFMKIQGQTYGFHGTSHRMYRQSC
jgi:acetate kinase